MKIYKWTMQDNEGVFEGYAGSLAEARKERAETMRASKESGFDPAPIDIRCYDVPITKRGFLDFLRHHTSHTSNGNG